MPKPSHFVVLVALAATILLVAPVATPAFARGGHASGLVESLNSLRASHGLAPLRPRRTLARGARAWSRHLMQTDSFRHASLLGPAGGWRKLGEVIAFRSGWRRGGGWAARAWHSSPGHLSVLLDPAFRSIGAGRARGRYGGRRATIWTVRVGLR